MNKNTGGKDSELHISLKLIAKSSIIVLIGLILSKILGYVYRIIIARYYGPEEYGLFTLALMILSLIVAFSSFGLSDGILRFIALYRGKNENGKIDYLLKFVKTILFISGVFFGLLLFFSSEFIALNIFHNMNLIVYLRIFSFLIPISLFLNFYLSMLKAYEEISKYSFLQNIFLPAIKVILIAVLIFISFKGNAVIFSYCLGAVFTFILAYLLCKYKLSLILVESALNKKVKRSISKQVFSYSWPIIFIGLIGNLLYWIDSFFIGYFKSVTDVGFYNAAVPLAALFLIASEIFMQLFYPLITREYSRKNFGLIKELSKQIGKWIFLINLPFFMIVMLFPGVIINIIFGSEYLVAENSLRILSLSVFFISVSNISSNLFMILGKSKSSLFYLGIALVLNIILDFIFVPKYGFMGAAVSTLFCQFFLGGILIYQVNKYLGIIPLRKKMLRIFLISLIPLAIIMILKKIIAVDILSLALLGVLFLGLYAFLVILTGCLDKNDMVIFNMIKKGIKS